MPVNPHVKGGTDVPVADGGTGASAGAGALTNLGGLSTASHAALNHAGIPGVGDLTTAAHSALDHSAIPGAGGGRPVSFSVVIPANSLNATGEMLLLYVSGSCGTWTGDLTLNGTALASPVGMVGPNWSGSFLIRRTTGTNATVVGSIVDTGATPKPALGTGSGGGFNWTASQTVAGSGAGFGAISQVLAVVMR
jgi:hypothetical protein